MHSCSQAAYTRSVTFAGIITGLPYLCKKVKVAHARLPSEWVPELIPVLGSQPAGDVSHKPGCRLPLLSAGPAVTLATLNRAATSFAAWRTEARRV